MSSKRKLGIFLVVLGGFLLLKQYFPEFLQSFLNVITLPLILVVIGLYLIVTTNK